MSTDDQIVILRTQSEGFTLADKKYEYRVAHVQAFDNYEYYEKLGKEYVDAYLRVCFSDDRVFLDKEEAYDAAVQLESDYVSVEYGIKEVERDEMFPYYLSVKEADIVLTDQFDDVER